MFFVYFSMVLLGNAIWLQYVPDFGISTQRNTLVSFQRVFNRNIVSCWMPQLEKKKYSSKCNKSNILNLNLRSLGLCVIVIISGYNFKSLSFVCVFFLKDYSFGMCPKIWSFWVEQSQIMFQIRQCMLWKKFHNEWFEYQVSVISLEKLLYLNLWIELWLR